MPDAQQSKRTPRIKLKQAEHMAKALARGEPHRGRIALTLFRNKVHELL